MKGTKGTRSSGCGRLSVNLAEVAVAYVFHTASVDQHGRSDHVPRGRRTAMAWTKSRHRVQQQSDVDTATGNSGRGGMICERLRNMAHMLSE